MDSDRWDEGFEAALAGAPETANPYDVACQFDEHTAWNDGWQACHQPAD